LAAIAKKAAVMVDVFIPASTTGLFGNPVIALQPGTQLDLPGRRQAKVTELVRVEQSGCVVRCEVLDAWSTQS
jgi:hypothetical protein